MRVGFLFLLLFAALSSGAQVLWLEDFEAEADGATSGTASGTIGGNWTTTYGGAGTFSKQSPFGFNLFQITDTDGEGVWNMAGPISIAGTGRAIVETTVVGLFTGAGDYIRLFYRVDGGPEILFFEQTGTIASFTLTGSAIVTGNTIEIVARATTNGDFFGIDSYTMDDIRITGINTLYSRKSGNWNDITPGNSTWSAIALGGVSCNCAPIATDYLIIGNTNAVDINTSATAGGIEIRNTGTLRYTAGTIDLNIDRGILQVDNGGSIDRNGQTGVQLDFDRGVISSFINNGTVSTENLRVTAALTQVNITGAGSIALTGDLSILQDDIVVDNDLSGTFTIADDLIFDQPGDFASDDAQFINRRTITISSDVVVGTNNDDGNILTNMPGATLTMVAINANDGNFNVFNSGTITQTSDFLNVVAGCNYDNLATGIWNWNFVQAAFDAQLPFALNCSASGNTFAYGAAGNQNIVAVTYHHLTISNSGTKSTTNNLDVNGNLLISGTARLNPNAGNDNITLGGNWTVTSTDPDPFEEGTEVVTLDGSLASQTVSTVLAGGESFSLLVLANTFGTPPQYVLGTTTVATALNLTSGIANLNGNTLTITSGAGGSLVYTNGWLAGGSLARAMPTGAIAVGNVLGHYPLGTLTNYRPLFIGKPAGTGAGTTTVFHDGTLSTTSNVSFADDLTITRRHDSFWDISSTFSGAVATWALRGGGTGFGTIQEVTDLRLSTSVGVVGNPGTNGGTIANPVVERLAVTIDQIKANNFHIASVDAINSPLPIQLVYFTAVPDAGKVRVNWKTESELNNDYFTLERTADAETFDQLVDLPGQGTTNLPTLYEHFDERPIIGTSYYRLRQTDFDGSYSYSPMVKVIMTAETSLKIFPNPVRGERLSIIVSGLEADEQGELRLVDATGRLSGAARFQADPAGYVSITVPVSGAAPGIYFVQIFSASARFVAKVVVP